MALFIRINSRIKLPAYTCKETQGQRRFIVLNKPGKFCICFQKAIKISVQKIAFDKTSYGTRKLHIGMEYVAVFFLTTAYTIAGNYRGDKTISKNISQRRVSNKKIQQLLFGF